MIDQILRFFHTFHIWLFEHIILPCLYATNHMPWADDVFEGLEWVLIGAIEVILLALILRTIERHYPLEPMTDPKSIHIDFIYTLLHRLGAFGLLVFAVLTPVFEELTVWLHLQGMISFNIEQIRPGLTDIPWISFMLYLIVFDFTDYWIHRGQHYFNRWWALHALHHSQRQMTLWTDDRNHILDDLLRDAIMACIALLIGTAPGQYVILVVATRVLQSLQHANLRCSFGRIFEKILVSPRYHRVHHAIGLGHEGTARGCNFAVLFPLWDILFATADFRAEYPATGIRDQLTGREYGRGFWHQQWLGLKRLGNPDA